MNTLPLIALGGMTVLTGLAVLVRAVRPAPPHLSTILSQLNAAPSRASTEHPAPSPAPTWVPASVTAFAERHLGATAQDLAILGRSRTELAVAKLTWAAGGALTPAVLGVVSAAAGMSLPVPLPAVTSMVLAVLGWLHPSRQVAQDADQARADFRSALAAFLALVGLERKARGSPAEALEEASRVSGSRPFRLLHTEVLRAELAAQPPWDALRELGHRIGVAELVNLADIVATAADGAAVFNTLMAEARNVRHADNTAQLTQASLANERLTLPTVCLFLCFAALLVYPAAVRLLTG